MMEEKTPAAAPSKPKGANPWQLLGVVGEIGYLVAIPAVLFGIGGAMLDERFQTKPWLTVGGLFFALFISAISVYHVVKRVLSQQS